MNNPHEIPLWGDIEIQGKDIAIPAVKFDRLAVGGRGELLLVSLIAEAQRVKQIRAILAGGAKVTIQATGVKLTRPGDEPWQAREPGRLYPAPDGYQCQTHKLGFGLVHAMFLTRTPGFLKVVTPESLWQELNAPRFTTPLLKAWVPYLEAQLRTDERLEHAHGFRCQCGVLSALTRHLDEVVSQGLAQGKIVLLPAAATATAVA
jgi:hypothetical protein